MKKYYTKLKNKSSVVASEWHQFKDLEWQSYYGFDAISVPSIIWRQEEVLRKICKQFPFKHVGLIRLPVNYNYNWHKDINRGCGINMLLDHGKSYALFAGDSKVNNSNTEEYDFDEFGMPFIELDYEPNTFYAFNTQELHCVFNFDKPRYLFTCEFEQDVNELSYETLNKYIKQNKL